MYLMPINVEFSMPEVAIVRVAAVQDGSQWRSGHSGLAWLFDYDWHCGTWGCLLCLCLPPLTLLIKAVNLGSFHWALSLFIYFRCMPDLWSSRCRCM